MAYANGVLGLHAPIRIRVTREINGEEHTGIINATLGRLIFNEHIPQDLGFVDRSDPAKLLDLEIDMTCGKKQLGQIINLCIEKHGFSVAAQVLDNIKAMGYKYSTKAAISISISDVTIPTRSILSSRRRRRRSRLSTSTSSAVSLPTRSATTTLSESGSRRRRISSQPFRTGSTDTILSR